MATSYYINTRDRGFNIQSALLALLVYLYSGFNSKCFWERIVKNDFGLQLAWDQAPHWGKRQKTGSNRKNIGERSKRSAFFFSFSPKPIFFPFSPQWEAWSQASLQSNRESREHQKYFWNVIVLREKTNKQTNKKTIRRVKTKRQARTLITVCGFVASSRVVIFAVIGHNAINIPEIFQVFTIFPVPL